MRSAKKNTRKETKNKFKREWTFKDSIALSERQERDEMQEGKRSGCGGTKTRGRVREADG